MSTEGRRAIREQRLFYAFSAGLLLVVGLAIVFYTGPGRGLLRGHLGDVVVVPFLYFLWAVIRPDGRLVRGLGVIAISFTLEFLQLLDWVDADSPLLLQITLGTTFDPWDFVAYVIGLACAVVIERWWFRVVKNRSSRSRAHLYRTR